MELVLVVLVYSGGWLEAIVLKWNWMFHNMIHTPECDRWMTRPSENQSWDDCIEEHKYNVAETLKEHGMVPVFIGYNPKDDDGDLPVEALFLMQR